MNDLSADDRAVVDRLRAALDEVAAGAVEPTSTAALDAAPGAAVAVVQPRPSRTAPSRWIGAAAATVLLAGGAVWALAQRSPVSRSTPGGPGASVPTPATFVPTTLPSSGTSDPRSPVTSQVVSPTVPSLASAPAYDLLGAFTEQPLVTNAGVPPGRASLLESWEIAADTTGAGPDGPGILVAVFREDASVVETVPGPDGATIVGGVPDGAESVRAPAGAAWYEAGLQADGTPTTNLGELWWERADGSTWVFFGQNMAKARLLRMAFATRAGSGLPLVLDEAAATLLTVGSASGESVLQSWTTPGGAGSATSGATSTVQLAMVRDGSAPLTLVSASNVVPVVVADHAGRQGLLPDGAVAVTWDAGGGWWGTFLVPPALARGADGLVESLVERAPAVVSPGGSVTTTPAVDGTTTVTSAPAAEAVRVRTTAMLIQQAGEPPKLAFGLKESAPPQGGDVPIAGFDWGMVDGELTMNGVTWSEVRWDLTGTYDGTTFTVASVVRHVDVTPPTLTTVVPVTGCTSATTQRAFDAVSKLMMKTAGPLEWSPLAGDGHCGARLIAIADTPALRAALATLPADVDVEVIYQIVPNG